MKATDEFLSKVPSDYRKRYVEIVTLTDEFCDGHLNDEYKAVCRKMTACLCQHGSPVLRGKVASWACGVAYAVGRVNFLTDPSQTPHMKAEQIAAGFGVSSATMHAKSREIHDGLNLMPLDPDFTVTSQVADNPLVWMLTVNGILTDIRYAPREAQVMAYEKGLIPYIPADRKSAT